MALKMEGMYETVDGTGDLSLTPRSGEAILVQDIWVDNPVSAAVKIQVSQTTVGFFRGSGVLGNHLPFPIQDEPNSSLFGFLRERGIFRPIPVAEGETLTISGVAQAGAFQCVRYDIYDAADVNSSMPNGSKNNELDYISYGTVTSALAAGVDTLDVMVNSSEFPSFPWESNVPDNRVIDWYGILASDVAKEDTSATNEQNTERLNFTLNQSVLFDLDLTGLLYHGTLPGSDVTVVGTGTSIAGNYSDTDERQPLLFQNPIRLLPGDELLCQWESEVISGSANLATTDCEVGLIFRLMKQTG